MPAYYCVKCGQNGAVIALTYPAYHGQLLPLIVMLAATFIMFALCVILKRSHADQTMAG